MDAISTQAAATAGRLRLVQSRFADEDSATRREELSEVVRDALAGMEKTERPAFLHQLADRFPSWPSTTDAEATPAPSREPPPSSPAELADAIVALPAETRQQIVATLEQHGVIAPRDATNVPPDQDAAAQALMQQMGLQEIDPARVLMLFPRLCDFIKSFERVTWSTWHLVAPRSTIKRDTSTMELLTNFVAGKDDTALEDVDASVEMLRKLAAALVASMSQVGQRMAQEYFARISPKEIEALVGVEKGGLLTSREVRCWRKYEELAGTFDEMAFEQEVKSVIATYAEALVKTSGQ